MLLPLLLTQACTSPPPAVALEIEADFAPAPTSTPTLHASLPAPELASESAYFVGSDAIVRLDAGGWTTIELPEAVTPFDVLRGTDGRVYARDWHHLGRLDGDRFELLASVDEALLIQDVAIGGSGELALVTSRPHRPEADAERTLHILRNGRWSAAPTHHEHWPFSRTAAFDRFGNLWTWQRSVVRSEWDWSTLTERSAAVELPAARLDGTLAASPGGDIYMFVDERVHRISDTAQVRIPLPGLTKPRQAFVNANGNFVLTWTDCTIARVIVEPASVEWFEPDVECLVADASVAIDGRDRVWVSTSSAALWVFPVGEEPIEYSIGTIPLAATGASAVAVVGRGPELPPVSPRPTTSIRGRVNVENGSGGTITRAIILRSRSKRSDGSREFEFRTVTNEHGDFEFANVPVARYEAATEDGEDEWLFVGSVQAMIDDGIIHLQKY